MPVPVWLCRTGSRRRKAGKMETENKSVRERKSKKSGGRVKKVKNLVKCSKNRLGWGMK